MDSSRTNEAIEDDYSPWQVSRLRTRLSHYRASKRHGWERIATDILYVEELPESYVDTEDVRPLSESLRRLDNGSQTPSAQRLHAVRIFLINQGYLNDHDLDDGSKNMAAPLAFSEFAAASVPNFSSIVEKTAQELTGVYSSSETYDDALWIDEIVIEFNGHVISATLKRSTFSDPGGKLNLKANTKLRNRNLKKEEKSTGWIGALNADRILFFFTNILYGTNSECQLLYATESGDDKNGEAQKLLMLPYIGKQKFDDFATIPFPSEKKPSISVTELFTNTTPRGFKIYAREAQSA